MAKLYILVSGKKLDGAATKDIVDALEKKTLTWSLKDNYLTPDDTLADPGKVEKRLYKFLQQEVPILADCDKMEMKSDLPSAIGDYLVYFKIGKDKPFNFTLTLAAPKGNLSKRAKSPADKARVSFDALMDPFLPNEPDPAYLFLRRFTVEVELTLDMRPEKSHQLAIRKAVMGVLEKESKRAGAVVTELEKSYAIALKKLNSDPKALKDAEKWLTAANRKLATIYNGVQPLAQKAGQAQLDLLAKKTPRLAAASLGASVVVNFSKLQMSDEIEESIESDADGDGEKSKAAAEALGEKVAEVAGGVKDGAKEQRKLAQLLDGLVAASLAVEKAAKDVKDDDDIRKTSDDAKDAKTYQKAKAQQDKLRALAQDAIGAYQSVVKEMMDGSRRTRDAIENLMKTAKKESFASEDMRVAAKKAQGALKPMRKDASGLYVAFNKIGGKLIQITKMLQKAEKSEDAFKRQEVEKNAKEIASPKPFKEAADLNKSVAAVTKILNP